MDDLEFRRRAYADPNCQDKDFLDYKHNHDEAAVFLNELHELDQSLKGAMHVEVPEGMAERIKLKQRFADHTETRRRWQFFSIAASILLVLGITLMYLPGQYPQKDNLQGDKLANVFMQHIYDELHHLHEVHPIDQTSVNQMLSSVGASLDQPIGKVNYLGSCDIGQKKGVHLVVQGQQGPVTILLLPDATAAQQQRIQDKRFDGMILPSRQGRVAIVGEKGEPLEAIKTRVLQHIHWI